MCAHGCLMIHATEELLAYASVFVMPQRNGGYWSDKGYEWYGGT
jgi:hypothetical protein